MAGRTQAKRAAKRAPKPKARPKARARPAKPTRAAKKPVKSAKRPAQARARPAASPQGWSDTAPPPALAQELAAQAGKAAALLLPGSQVMRPAEVVKALLEHADALRSGAVKLARRERGERCLMMACLWGEQLRAELGWSWAEVRWPEGSSIGVVAPDRSYAVFPLPYFTRVIDEPGLDNTILLLFNMIVAGNLPPSAPGKYVTLS